MQDILKIKLKHGIHPTPKGVGFLPERFCNLKYEIECLEAAEKELLKRLPFKKGDKVKLKKSPVITNGWLAHKYMLEKGAEATIYSVSVAPFGITYNLVFDAEGRKHTFNFTEDFIQKSKQ